MLYILVKSKNAITLERIEESTWELIQTYPNKDIKNYVTMDIEDEELQKYGIDTIIWERIWDPNYRFYRKVNVPFTPYDVSKIEENAEIERKKIYEKITKEKALIDNQKKLRAERIAREKVSPERVAQKEEIGKQRKELDEIIPMDMDNLDALMKWKELGYPQPTAHKIEAIKNSYNMSWKEFTDYMKETLTLNF